MSLSYLAAQKPPPTISHASRPPPRRFFGLVRSPRLFTSKSSVSVDIKRSTQVGRFQLALAGVLFF